MVLVGQDAIQAIDKGGNMAAPLLAEAVGGTGFLGFIAAVAFATILAVVAGLTLSGAAALSHDLWVNVVRGGQAPEHEQLRVARGATVLLGIVSIVLGIAFKGQNVAYMVGLAFAIAASANFPALVLSIFWRPLHDPRRPGQHARGHGVRPGPDLPLPHHPGPDPEARLGPVSLEEPRARHDPPFVSRGDGRSLLAPEPEAEARYAEIEERIHLGELADTATRSI